MIRDGLPARPPRTVRLVRELTVFPTPASTNGVIHSKA
jgi:hypothetical protein